MSRRSSVNSTYSGRNRSNGDESEYKGAFISVVKTVNETISTRQQLTQALQYAGRNPTAKQVAKIWSDSPTGGIGFKDFCRIIKDFKPTSKSQLLAGFRKIDINGDGFISESELYRLFTARGEKMTKSEVKKLLDSADVNKDGRLDYDEFCDLMLSTTTRCKELINKKILKTTTTTTTTDEIETAKPVPIKRVSQASLQNTSDLYKRTAIIQKMTDAIVVKGPALTDVKTPKPKSLKGWSNAKSKGCFYVDSSDEIVGHTYKLELPFASNVHLAVQSSALKNDAESWTSTVDIGAFVFRESKSDDENKFLFVTECKDNGKNFWTGDLRSGSYVIIPFTSGCKLKSRDHNDDDLPLTRKDLNDEVKLTRPFCETLADIFELCDLDDNNKLSRDEFNWFQVRTNDEEVDDDAWKVVLENFETDEGEMTRKGFEELHLMQAQEEENDPQHEFIDMLKSVGFNGSLDLVQACPFQVEVFAKECNPLLSVASLSLPEERVMREAMFKSIESTSEVVPLKLIDELSWFVYFSDSRASSFMRNKTARAIEVNVNCSQSKNCMTSQRKDNFNLKVPAHGTVMVDHSLPAVESEKWSYHCCITKPTKTSSKPTSKRPSSVASSKKESILSIFK
ncbi:EF-hand calcium-binding domain-containing protein 7 [Ciona intestinalis]